MTIKPEKFVRKPIVAEGIQVNPKNMAEIARWCKGSIEREGARNEITFIKVEVFRPLNDRQTKAYDTDWVLFGSGGFKVYTDHAFRNSFDKAEETLDSRIEGSVQRLEEIITLLGNGQAVIVRPTVDEDEIAEDIERENAEDEEIVGEPS